LTTLGGFMQRWVLTTHPGGNASAEPDDDVAAAGTAPESTDTSRQVNTAASNVITFPRRLARCPVPVFRMRSEIIWLPSRGLNDHQP
jgi:hypothetical protein